MLYTSDLCCIKAVAIEPTHQLPAVHVKTRQWQDPQWINKSDRRACSAYYHVLKHLDSSLSVEQQAGFQDKLWAWVESWLEAAQLQVECPSLYDML